MKWGPQYTLYLFRLDHRDDGIFVLWRMATVTQKAEFEGLGYLWPVMVKLEGFR